MGQDLRQLLRVQPQEVGGSGESCPDTNTQRTVQSQTKAERRRWKAAGSSIKAKELHFNGRESEKNKNTRGH